MIPTKRCFVAFLSAIISLFVATPASATLYDLGDFPFSFFGATDLDATLETSTTGTFTTESDIEDFLNLASYSVTLKDGATDLFTLDNSNSSWNLQFEAFGGGSGGATASLTATPSEITLDFSTPNEITRVDLFLRNASTFDVLQYSQANNVTDFNFVFVSNGDLISSGDANTIYDAPFVFPAVEAEVPEPSTFALIGAGLLGLVRVRRRNTELTGE